jgi:CheY-like chemotaxis protein
MTRKPHHVLLVDDDPMQQLLSERALKKALCSPSTFLTVRSGNEAIAYLIGEGPFADRIEFPFPIIIITDLNMPDGDGFGVLEFLQGNDTWSIVPRILFSNSADENDVRMAFQLGCSAYHLKAAGAGFDAAMCRLIEYWTNSEVPRVDAGGRLPANRSEHRGRRFTAPVPELESMKRRTSRHESG